MFSELGALKVRSALRRRKLTFRVSGVQSAVSFGEWIRKINLLRLINHFIVKDNYEIGTNNSIKKSKTPTKPQSFHVSSGFVEKLSNGLIFSNLNKKNEKVSNNLKRYALNYICNRPNEIVATSNWRGWRNITPLGYVPLFKQSLENLTIIKLLRVLLLVRD